MSKLPNRNRLTTLISILLLSGFLVTNLAGYFASTFRYRASMSGTILPLTGDTIYSEIQKDLIQPIFISSMMANDTFLKDWVMDDEQGTERITRYLSEIQRQYDTVTSFFISEKTRRYYYHKGILKTVKRDSPADAWYFRVREMEQPYELNVDPDMANKDAMTIFINYRVLDYQGKYIGATGCGLTVSRVHDLLNTYAKRYNRNIYFVTPKGEITLTNQAADLQLTNTRSIDGLREVMPELTIHKSGSFDFHRNGETYLLHTRYISELGWHLFVEQNVGNQMQQIRKTLYTNLLICLFISLIILGAVHYTLRRYQSRLEEMATTDKLTGLINRYAFEAIFNHAIKEKRRDNHPLSLILFDIDRFKEINDMHGHLAGDQVITVVADTAKSCIRDADSLCRWGGEEFIILLKKCGLEDGYLLAEKIRTKVAETTTVHHEQSLQVQVSLGVAELQHDEPSETFLQRVDKALYRAKDGGRNRTEKHLGTEK